MTTPTSTPATAAVPRRAPRTRSALLLLAAAVAACAVNALVARAAVAAGAPAGYGPLTPPAYCLLTVVGVGLGWLGWRAVRARARDPRRALSVLVPVVTLATFVPDLLLLALRFVPGTTTTAVLALVLMHLVVVACAVPAYALATRAGTAAATA